MRAKLLTWGAEMKSIFVKFLIVLSQLGNFTALFIIAFGGNYWFIIPAILPFSIFMIMAMTGHLLCIHCSTPLWDTRTIGKWIPVRPSVVDKCGECGRSLFD